MTQLEKFLKKENIKPESRDAVVAEIAWAAAMKISKIEIENLKEKVIYYRETDSYTRHMNSI